MKIIPTRNHMSRNSFLHKIIDHEAHSFTKSLIMNDIPKRNFRSLKSFFHEIIDYETYSYMKS